jgi:hypothetical protein
MEKIELKGKTYFTTDSGCGDIKLVWKDQEDAEAGGKSYAILMPNNEVLRDGKSLGFIKK